MTKKCLLKIKPAICIFIGIAGGNGLEHIDNDISKNIIGIDMNQEYPDISSKRNHDKIECLQLLKLDVIENTNQICSADFIWVALVLEYAGIDKCLGFSKNNILSGGHFIATIQSNNKLKSVSLTGIESVKKAVLIFEAINPKILLAKANEMNFTLINSEENQLPNGKKFLIFDFMRR